MKHIVAVVVLAVVLTTGVALAQQAPAQKPGAPGQAPTQGEGGMCQMMGGVHGGGMMGGGMMGGGMMGMMGGQSDPRAIQMRGEMMKAMGEIMMKYGKAMEGSGSR